MPNSVIGDSASNCSTQTVIPNSYSTPSLDELSPKSSWRGRSVSSGTDSCITGGLTIQSIAKPEKVISVIFTDCTMKKSKKKGLLRRFGNKCVSFFKNRKKKELMSLGRQYEIRENLPQVAGQYGARTSDILDKFSNIDKLSLKFSCFDSNHTFDAASPHSIKTGTELRQNHSILLSDEMIAFNELGILDQIQLIVKSSKELKEICGEKGRNVDCSVITDFVWEIYRIIYESESYQSTVPSTGTMAQVYLEIKERIEFVKRRPIGPIANEQKLILDPIRSNIVLKNGDVIEPRPAQ